MAPYNNPHWKYQCYLNIDSSEEMQNIANTMSDTSSLAPLHIIQSITYSRISLLSSPDTANSVSGISSALSGLLR